VAAAVAPCKAAIRFELPEVSVVVSGSQPAVGYFEAVVRADPSDLPKNVSSFNIDFHTSSTSLTLGPGQTASNPLFSGDVSNFSDNAQTVQAGTDVFPSSVPLFDSARLVRVPFQVPFGSSGVFPLEFGPFNELTDSTADSLPIQTTDTGSVTVIVAAIGDYNHNGVVEAADYVVWRRSLGSAANLAADGNLNSIVDGNDYGVWRSNFGAAGPHGLGTSSIPEPSTTVVSLISLVVYSALMRRKRNWSELTYWGFDSTVV